jgi:ubiquinone/menaquinone biosynthesis C-methylase UbiE
MKKEMSRSITEHYLELYKKFGESPKALGWIKGNQDIRFDVISQIGELKNSSILDVGCGFGDFYGYLKSKKIKFEYHGVDINKKFLEIAKKRNPNGKFELRDIQKKKITKKFDWVIATGITNHATNYQHLKEMLKEMFRICKKGVIMDFISNYVDYEDKEIFYTSPEKIFQAAKDLTRRVTLRHDYMPFEFCLYLYKNDKKTSKNVFSEIHKEFNKK